MTNFFSNKIQWTCKDMEEASSKKTIYTMFQYVHSFFFLFIFAIITSVLLVYPTYSYISILLQLVFINLWVYAMHRLSHNLPNIPVNYHLYSHHNKQLNLPRPIELVFEFVTDFSWYLLLLAFQYYYKLSFLSPTLIIFLGLWY